MGRETIMTERKAFHVAVVGATGAVGQQMLKTLEERNFPISTLTLLSSPRSAGKAVIFKGQEYIVQEAKPESFENVDIALFSAGGGVSKELAPEAVKGERLWSIIRVLLEWMKIRRLLYQR